jgi:hypothetical protein
MFKGMLIGNWTGFCSSIKINPYREKILKTASKIIDYGLRTMNVDSVKSNQTVTVSSARFHTLFVFSVANGFVSKIFIFPPV